MKPFVIFDHEEQKLIFILQGVNKIIPLGQLKSNEDFFDEFFRRFKDINFVQKYGEINRKDLLSVIEDLGQREVVEATVKIERTTESSGVKTSETEIDVSNSPLIRSSIEKKISVDDLGMKFNTPYDYFDLSVFNEDKVKKSVQLDFFLKKGFIVRTSFDEIEKIRSKCMAEKAAVDNVRRNKQIVNRDEVLGENDSNLITDDQFQQAMRETEEIDRNIEVHTQDGKISAGEIKSMFEQRGIDSMIGNEADSVEKLLART